MSLFLEYLWNNPDNFSIKKGFRKAWTEFNKNDKFSICVWPETTIVAPKIFDSDLPVKLSFLCSDCRQQQGSSDLFRAVGLTSCELGLCINRRCNCTHFLDWTIHDMVGHGRTWTNINHMPQIGNYSISRDTQAGQQLGGIARPAPQEVRTSFARLESQVVNWAFVSIEVVIVLIALVELFMTWSEMVVHGAISITCHKWVSTVYRIWYTISWDTQAGQELGALHDLHHMDKFTSRTTLRWMPKVNNALRVVLRCLETNNLSPRSR